MHNLTKVEREKSESGIFSDYPHFFKLRVEGKNDVAIYGTRNSENGDFLLSTSDVRKY